ncbi:MAG: cytochrome c [Holophagales bacterium]|nr:cytochrome c [Holophagales bacterium]
MSRALRLTRPLAGAATVLLLAPAVAAGLNVDQPTFIDDIAPILHENCASCHQPDEIAPMSLRTYREARPWARSIARAVENKDMPPWDADPGYGPWANDMSLSDDEIAAITRGAGNRAPRGDGDEPVYEKPE